MKLHRTLVQAIAGTLQQIFVERVYADKAVEQILKQNPRWGSRDRRFIAETTYEMVRWWRYISESFCPSGAGKVNVEEAIGTEYFYKLFATWQILKGLDLPDWEEFSGIDKNQIVKNAEQVKLIRKYRESIPDWLDELGGRELGEAVWGNELHALNTEAQVVLRVNTLKTSSEELKNKLLTQGIGLETLNNTSPLFETIKKGAFVLSKRQNLHQLNEYKEGLFEIQDASSQLIAPFLQLKEGMKVIDACAGAGGKSLHMAAMMQNKGEIISMDVEERKLTELKRRSDRAGVRIIKTQLINAASISKFKNSADRLLLDVPCSGLGVIRRNPDAKWKLNLDFIDQIKKTQQEIICNYSQMLKSGGIMVYATCSILPSENQQQVEAFLIKNKNNFEFIEDRKVLPSEGFDGFYMAAIRKK
ncbi:MAG: RsmB/NOP family class I SAM-dependent RNA methyltransferase [Bacteroidia bacterium]|nr:RsmB/NOP family class I SAM-dependent RNA methyltransferase [Bacteroidia bacterium]